MFSSVRAEFGTAVALRWLGLAVVALLLVIARTALPAATASAAGCSTGPSSSCAVPTTKRSGPASLIGQSAPPTVGPNLTGSGSVDLAAPTGIPTAVVFWLNSCPHCQEALPGVNRLAAKLGTDRAIETGAIDIGARGSKGFETPAAAVKTLGLRMPTALITKALADQWKIASTPTAFILDSGGTIRSVIVPTDPKQLAPALDRALRRTD